MIYQKYLKFINLFSFIWKFLNKKQRLKFIFTLFLNPLSELLTIIMLTSIFAQIMQSDLPSYLNLFKEFLDIIKTDINSYIFLIIIIFTFIVFMTINALCRFISLKLSFELGEKISFDSFKIYTNKNYEDFISYDQSKIISDVLINSERYSTQIFAPLIEMLQRIILVSLIFISMILINFKITLFISILFLLFFLFYFFFNKKKLRFFGKQFLKIAKIKTEIVKSSIRNYKDLVISNSFFKELIDFRATTEKKVKVHSMGDFLNILPKYILEIIFIISFILAFKLIEGQENINIKLAEYSFFFVSFYKLAPSLNVINSTLLKIYTNYELHSTIAEIYKMSVNEKNVSDKEIEKIDFNFKSIEFKNTKFKYQKSLIKKKDYFPGLNTFNLKIKSNSKIGLFGESGSGKTTFLDLFCLLLKPTDGEIIINDSKLNNISNLYKKKIGYVAHNSSIRNQTLAKIISNEDNLENINNERISYCLDFFQLSDFKSKIFNDDLIGDDGSLLSSGQLQRICLAKCLYANPDIIIMDEATNNLDEITEKKIIDKLIKLEKTIIFSSHKIENFNGFDLILKFDKGNLIDIKNLSI